MPVQRMTAKKVRISDLVNGKWVKNEGMTPSFVVTPGGEEVARARIMGTIVSSFASEDESFASITIDDSTETIRAKTFKTTKPLDGLVVGNVVDVIGKVREYMGEIYVIPEIVSRVDDPNLELLRRLEMTRPAGLKAGKGKSGTEKGKQKESEKGEKAEKDDRGELKRKVLKFIESGDDGVEYGEILENVKGKEIEIESVVNEVLAEGICYEPTPGRIKKI